MQVRNIIVTLDVNIHMFSNGRYRCCLHRQLCNNQGICFGRKEASEEILLISVNPMYQFVDNERHCLLEPMKCALPGYCY